ncbi:sulfotransferase domain-containing protein [Candidatus Pelagibacter sp.]|uniref:sulfotransferase domain-containing protein n=1 Tax=Candidatus Pelagibacter sp. TaxID=2024849 RepID=UPI003F85531B
MFIWLASYPKSGNTLLRSMLAAYFFSTDGVYNFDLIKNIKQFPNITLFERLGIDIKNEKEVVKNYIKVQESFNNKNSVQFLKTHSYLFNIDNHAFTDLNNSLGSIYIARDPRNVVTSYANHTNIGVDEAADDLINLTQMGGDLGKTKGSERTKVFTGNWGGNFNSWKSFKFQDRYLLIKYEDLISEKEKTFIKVLKFIHKLKKADFKIDDKKLKNVILTTDFSRMKKLEQEEGFFESKIDKITGKKIPFFNLGEKNDWNKILNKEIKKKIETAFQKEMKELGYI